MRAAQIAFVMRQSPDWPSLSRDYKAGTPIDAGRYKPAKTIAGFPDNIEACIETWNRIFPVDFFACRAELRRISRTVVAAVDQSILVSEKEFTAHHIDILAESDFIAYLDDDDWFCPDTCQILSAVASPTDDILVFPLVRFDTHPSTFVRAGKPARTVIGTRCDFDFRFQTNNYVLRSDRLSPLDILSSKDHVEASQYADAKQLSDSYYDAIISATNKTPCSAGKLPSLVEHTAAYVDAMKQYLKQMSGLHVPEEISWCRTPLAETVQLFTSVLATDRLP